jgi:HEAT repeat protein
MCFARPFVRTAVRLAILIAGVCFTGCAEGPFWRSGKYAPWVRNQWAEEERLADTLFERRRQMNELAATAKTGSPDSRQAAASRLTDVVMKDPVLLLRLHAVGLLGQLDCPTAVEGLKRASTDPDADVRMAAVKAWASMRGEIAIGQLQEMVGSDTNIDVRLAATRALGNFSGQQAIAALSLALQDNDPALQVRATESLARITGESIGPDVRAWQNYVAQMTQGGDVIRR